MEKIKKKYIKRRSLNHRNNKTIEKVIRYDDATKENITNIIKLDLKFKNIH